MSKQETLLALKLVAAKAEKLAYDFEHNKLWDGDLQRGLAELKSQIASAESASR